jgi:hypothetical protein
MISEIAPCHTCIMKWSLSKFAQHGPMQICQFSAFRRPVAPRAWLDRHGACVGLTASQW